MCIIEVLYNLDIFIHCSTMYTLNRHHVREKEDCPFSAEELLITFSVRGVKCN